MNALGAKTIGDFDEQWSRYTENSGFYGSKELFEDIIRRNLMGTVLLVEAVLPEMLARRLGQLVGVSSLAAYRGLPHTPV